MAAVATAVALLPISGSVLFMKILRNGDDMRFALKVPTWEVNYWDFGAMLGQAHKTAINKTCYLVERPESKPFTWPNHVITKRSIPNANNVRRFGDTLIHLAVIICRKLCVFSVRTTRWLNYANHGIPNSGINHCSHFHVYDHSDDIYVLTYCIRGFYAGRTMNTGQCSLI